jgi:hypothetical protein
MWTQAVDQAIYPRAVTVEHQILAEQANRFRRTLVHLRDGRNGVPVPTQVLAHGRPCTDLGEKPVLGFCEHRPSWFGDVIIGTPERASKRR